MSVFSKFHTKTRKERLSLLVSEGLLDQKDLQILEQSVHSDIVDQAEHFIENVIGCFPLPLGVLPNCIIDGVARTIPLAVEETSIIAALNKTAKWVNTHGNITTKREGTCIIGQIQCNLVVDTDAFAKKVLQHRSDWIQVVNKHVFASLVRRGGGLEDIKIRFVPGKNGQTMAVLHLHANTLDAMGANLINQACEYLKPKVMEATDTQVDMCIVSNLNDAMLTSATIRLEGIAEEEGKAIAMASDFAWQDPYRACTNNKGVLNGIDPILIATGNDWRAVEAGIHAYAHKEGQYRSITTWEYTEGTLIGHFKAPVIVGTVGGVTTLHPLAKVAMKLLGVVHAKDLSRICAAVGLLQNLAALRALSTKGIVQGHMKLHIDNLILATGADYHEMPALKQKLIDRLALCRKITQSDAIELLYKLRQTQPEPA